MQCRAVKRGGRKGKQTNPPETQERDYLNSAPSFAFTHLSLPTSQRLHEGKRIFCSVIK